MALATKRTVEPVYRKLADVNEIRLLYLQPGCTSDPIACRMVHSNLLDNIQYESLSYMWGSKVSPLQIQVNGAMVDVKDNLHQALKRIRLAETVRVLWIDALCINRDDINERNHQVSQMGRIYEKATGVVAWLGLLDHSSMTAMKYILDFRLGIPKTRYS
jgi:hypothetical protein